MKQKGRVTIPTDENFIEGTKEIAKLWGADAVRDCDGTVLPANAAELAEQIQADWREISLWQVFDRTTGDEIFSWRADEKTGIVHIENITPYHEYTVNFMAKVIWHPVQIYNYLTNNWTCEKQCMYDPAFPHTAKYIKKFMADW